MIERFAEAGGLRWRLRETNPDAAEAVLFLHGFTLDGTYWEETAGKLARRRCVAPDLPGHGRSGLAGR